MKPSILAAAAAAAVALSLPAVALPHEETYRQVRPPPPPSPASAERREVAELRQLMARLDDAAASRARREVAWIEAELLRACEREIAEARAARFAGLHEVPGSRRYQRAAWIQPSSARLDALLSVRAGLLGLRGRSDWRAVSHARDLGAELVRLAALDVRYGAPPPPPPYYGERDPDRDRDRVHGYGRN